MGYYLMVKNPKGHKVKYLCKCMDNRDPYEYKGSGVFWRKIIKKLGVEIETEILGHYETKETLREAGEYYSEKFDIVHNREWANLIPEIGDGGSTTAGWVRAYNEQTKEERCWPTIEDIPQGWKRGNLPFIRTPEHIEKVRQIHLGRKRSEETRQNMRNAVRKKRMTIPCVYCSRQITPQNIKRHTEHCKEKKNVYFDKKL